MRSYPPRRRRIAPVDTTWHARAACRTLPDPLALFFGPDGEPRAERADREAAAQQVCASCPVVAACAAHARTLPERHGVWGGLTETQRRTERRAARREAA